VTEVEISEVKIATPFLKISQWAQKEHPNGALQLRKGQVKFIFYLIVRPAGQPAHMDHQVNQQTSAKPASTEPETKDGCCSTVHVGAGL